ncbi:unnamed protein product [Fraxinus pennsylvanica]|uniref:Ubiquitin-activating enzyme SCCH domain-containing protein n=1 Tax=Fraxinus pennsylvanica TaxID=56036 RepID=A0AAD1Z9W7_9LAMI|nr:unnamed protein product [Fraxinus pennsylvanica]
MWRNFKKPRPIYVKYVFSSELAGQNGNLARVQMNVSLLPPPQEIGNLSFDKDNQLAVEFVIAAANIRASSFAIPLHGLFEAEGIAGNIVHSVATTNAIC